MKTISAVKNSLCLVPALGVAPCAWPQQLPEILTDSSVPVGEGWRGFLEFAFLGNTLLTLILAAVLGGLIRFRTVLRSANLTGRVIFVTLIGLTCGLDLPHVAVLATAFAFLLVFILESRVTYRVDVHAVDREHVSNAAAAYRDMFAEHGCRILSERKNPIKQRITFLISGPNGVRRDELEALIENGIDEPLKGAVDWQTD